MPFTKIFGTTSGAYSTDTNWKPIDISNPLYSWTLSGSGTTEYYLRTAAGANPGFVASPPTADGVYINGSAATKATLGSLTAGQWGYGDNDALGYSTVYVRLSDGTDPDTKDPNYVKFYQMPQATEHVHFAPDSASITSAVGLDQSGVAIGDFIVEKGHAGTIGSATLGYLHIDPDRFECHNGAECWINLFSAAIPATIRGTGNVQTGKRGLYLIGTGITVLNVLGGHVGLAVNGGEVSTATTVRVQGTGSSCWLGIGVTVTNVHQYDGELRVRCPVTTVIVYAGTQYSEENGTMTTVTTYGGEYIYNSTGDITTLNYRGGVFDSLRNGDPRTIGTLNVYRASGQLKIHDEAVTITTTVIQESLNLSVSS